MTQPDDHPGSARYEAASIRRALQDRGCYVSPEELNQRILHLPRDQLSQREIDKLWEGLNRYEPKYRQKVARVDGKSTAASAAATAAPTPKEPERSGTPYEATWKTTQRPSIPKTPELLLIFVCPPKDLEPLLGDLEHTFHIVAERFGEKVARRWYWYETMRSAISYGGKWVTLIIRCILGLPPDGPSNN